MSCHSEESYNLTYEESCENLFTFLLKIKEILPENNVKETSERQKFRRFFERFQTSII